MASVEITCRDWSVVQLRAEAARTADAKAGAAHSGDCDGPGRAFAGVGGISARTHRAPPGPRRCRRGAKSSLRREPNMPADLLRAPFGNVTVPFGLLATSQGRAKWTLRLLES
jgi:hypothetical protein